MKSQNPLKHRQQFSRCILSSAPPCTAMPIRVFATLRHLPHYLVEMLNRMRTPLASRVDSVCCFRIRLGKWGGRRFPHNLWQFASRNQLCGMSGSGRHATSAEFGSELAQLPRSPAAALAMNRFASIVVVYFYVAFLSQHLTLATSSSHWSFAAVPRAPSPCRDSTHSESDVESKPHSRTVNQI
jgi:hypothetical protein